MLWYSAEEGSALFVPEEVIGAIACKRSGISQVLNRLHDVASQGWRSCQLLVRRVSRKPYNTQVRFCITRKGYSGKVSPP